MRTLSALGRASVDLRMLLHTITTGLAESRRHGLTSRDTYRFIRNQIVLSSGLSSCKYISFDGKVFMDSFAPHWPSEAFTSLSRSYARGTTRDREFIDYAVLAVTNRCMFRCAHCYAVGMLKSRDDLSRDDLLGAVKDLQRIGVGILSLEGGEPLLRFEDLIAVMESVKPGTALWLATTGYGLTGAMARTLKETGLVGATVSLDHYDPQVHNTFRGSPKAFSEAVKAVTLFREAGVFPVVTMVPSREMLLDGGLYRYLEMARKLGAGMVQVLDPMPSGKYLGDRRSFFTKQELDQVIDFQITVNTHRKFREYPAVSSRAYIEDESRYGCGMGGNQYIYIDASGNVQPCVYLNVSFGNILTDGFESAYRRMRRTFPHPVDGPCPAFYLHTRVNEVHSRGVPLPLGSDYAERICRDMHGRGLPGIFARLK